MPLTKWLIYDWISHFKKGRQSVFVEEISVQPCEVGNKKIEDCAKIVKEEHRITIRNLSQKLNVNVGGVLTILHELGIRKLASRFVQGSLHRKCVKIAFNVAKRTF